MRLQVTCNEWIQTTIAYRNFLQAVIFLVRGERLVQEMEVLFLPPVSATDIAGNVYVADRITIAYRNFLQAVIFLVRGETSSIVIALHQNF